MRYLTKGRSNGGLPKMKAGPEDRLACPWIGHNRDPKALNAITEEDLQALIINGVAEGRTIDYRSDLPGNSDGDKKELLADVSSFANTGGGDLVFGMVRPGVCRPR